LHSGPLTNFGSGIRSFIDPTEKYFTDGCMAINSEVNHQFSTVEFTFPTEEVEALGEKPCLEIKSYSESKDNIIFQKKLCGEIMREGTLEMDTCTMPRFTLKTQVIFIFAICIIGFNFIVALWVLGYKGCLLAMGYFGIGLLFFWVTVLAAIAGALCFGTLGVNVFAIAIFTLVQSVIGACFIGMVLYYRNTCPEESTQRTKRKERKAKDPRKADGEAPLSVQVFDNEVDDTVETVASAARKDVAEKSVDSKTAGMKEIVGIFSEDSEDSNAFDVGVWDSNSVDEDYSQTGQTDPSRYIEVMLYNR
jgi:hypothetical protein